MTMQIKNTAALPLFKWTFSDFGKALAWANRDLLPSNIRAPRDVALLAAHFSGNDDAIPVIDDFRDLPDDDDFDWDSLVVKPLAGLQATMDTLPIVAIVCSTTGVVAGLLMDDDIGAIATTSQVTTCAWDDSTRLPS